MEDKKRLSLKDLTALFHEKKDFEKVNLEGGSWGTEVELRHKASGCFTPYSGHLGVAYKVSNGEYNQVENIRRYASGIKIYRDEAEISYSNGRLVFHSLAGSLNVNVLPEELEKADYWGNRNRISMPLSQNGLSEFELYISAEK